MSGLSLTSKNYNLAIKILEKQYSNKQLLIKSHTNQLLSILSITSTNHIKKIRETYHKTETNMQNLCPIDFDTSQYGPVLISIVISKLPEDITLQISWSMPVSRDWDVDEL